MADFIPQVFCIIPLYYDSFLVTFKCRDCDKTLEARFESKYCCGEKKGSQWFVESHHGARSVNGEWRWMDCDIITDTELQRHPRIQQYMQSVPLPLADLDSWWRSYMLNYYHPNWGVTRAKFRRISKDLNPVHPLLSDVETE